MQTNHDTTSPLKLLRGLIPDRRVQPHEHRQIAELQANWLRRLLETHGSSIDTVSIVGLPHIDLQHDRSLPTSGMSFWNGRSWVILLNPTETTNRQRFTLLHELHHIICHSKRTHLFGAGAAQDDPAAERMADYFAACALMPKLYVKRLFGQGIHDPKELADHFEVSALAMSVRLDQLGLTNTANLSRRCSVERRLRPGLRSHQTEATSPDREETR